MNHLVAWRGSHYLTMTTNKIRDDCRLQRKLDQVKHNYHNGWRSTSVFKWTTESTGGATVKLSSRRDSLRKVLPVLKSVICSATNCSGSIIRSNNSKNPNKLIINANSVLGTPLAPQEMILPRIILHEINNKFDKTLSILLNSTRVSSVEGFSRSAATQTSGDSSP